PTHSPTSGPRPNPQNLGITFGLPLQVLFDGIGAPINAPQRTQFQHDCVYQRIASQKRVPGRRGNSRRPPPLRTASSMAKR
ncbi:MAG: hypothetical protein ACLPPT_14365, partial [Mycobacterium sp.]|uniref:hypothetical protein n=1 Tax=Mycobacterium sp. TaxID=1785 RepID=UPI003F970BB3